MSSNDLRIMLANTWFGCITMRYSNIEQVEEVFRSAHVVHSKEAKLDMASWAARAQQSAAANIVQVEVLVHSKDGWVISNDLSRWKAWLDMSTKPQIIKIRVEFCLDRQWQDLHASVWSNCPLLRPEVAREDHAGLGLFERRCNERSTFCRECQVRV